jgi:ribonuclease HII
MSLKLRLTTERIEAGCDEAGRGCLAGPVVAAAVILPDNFENSLLNDSKKLTENQRNKLYPIIIKEAIAYGVGVVPSETIDDINILNSSFLAMHYAVDLLDVRPELLLIDGNRFSAYPQIDHECIIKGDGKYMSIAAASILAKVFRDGIMKKMHHQFPVFDWHKNKGYPTKKHRASIFEFGDTHYHRKTFKLLADDQMEL